MIGVAFCCALTTVAKASGGESPFSIAGPTMGTTYSVTFHGVTDALDVDLLRSDIELLLERIEARMSTWRSDSEISRFNRHASTEPFAASADTLEVFRIGAAGVDPQGLSRSRRT